MTASQPYHFFPFNREKLMQEIGKEALLTQLSHMLTIRNLEIRGEAAYQMGKVGGFYHSYIGQEAIQTACVFVSGNQHWYTATYRCHALAYLLGVLPREIMAEFYGKQTGNALGRGGSMHLYADHLLGGLAIVGGHVPIATGAAFSIKYQDQKDLVSYCFMGDGAVAQGAVHESLNLASLWNLPCIYVIENNQWGMGTKTQRAICVKPIAEHLAKGYDISSMTLDGQDFFNCYAGFKHALEEVKKTSRPILIEVICERFKGHSISDPGLYRSKEDLLEIQKRDPILLLKNALLEKKMLSEDEFLKMDEKAREIALDAMNFAENSPDPDPIVIEEGVFAPRDEK